MGEASGTLQADLVLATPWHKLFRNGESLSRESLNRLMTMSCILRIIHLEERNKTRRTRTFIMKKVSIWDL